MSRKRGGRRIIIVKMHRGIKGVLTPALNSGNIGRGEFHIHLFVHWFIHSLIHSRSISREPARAVAMLDPGKILSKQIISGSCSPRTRSPRAAGTAEALSCRKVLVKIQDKELPLKREAEEGAFVHQGADFP